MDSRVGGTGLGQNWRISGIQQGDPDYIDNRGVPRVAVEFWLTVPTSIPGVRTYPRFPATLDPELARELGQQLIEMADYAEASDAA